MLIVDIDYVKPEDVTAPRGSWNLKEVIFNNGPGDCAYALGLWDGEPRIGFRWNGDENNKTGNPTSRGHATWTMLQNAPALHEAVLDFVMTEKRKEFKEFLGLSDASRRSEGQL